MIKWLRKSKQKQQLRDNQSNGIDSSPSWDNFVKSDLRLWKSFVKSWCMEWFLWRPSQAAERTNNIFHNVPLPVSIPCPLSSWMPTGRHRVFEVASADGCLFEKVEEVVTDTGCQLSKVQCVWRPRGGQNTDLDWDLGVIRVMNSHLWDNCFLYCKICYFSRTGPVDQLRQSQCQWTLISDQITYLVWHIHSIFGHTIRSIERCR